MVSRLSPAHFATALHAYLTILSGNRAGASIGLHPGLEYLLGRGSDCQIPLPDPLCSRVHARIAVVDDAWMVADSDSRNGTFVNGQKVTEATLGDGHQVRIGGTELEFHLTEVPPTAEGDNPHLTQTLVQNVTVGVGDGDSSGVYSELPNAEQVKELMLLHQLSNKLLGVGEPEEVVRMALDLLRARTAASVVGFLWMNDEGQLRPKHVTPADAANRVTLNPSLTELVCQKGNAVWVANQAGRNCATELEHFADGICARWCIRASTANAPPSAPFTFIWKMAVFASPISISPFRWRIKWRWRSSGRSSLPASRRTSRDWCKARRGTKG